MFPIGPWWIFQELRGGCRPGEGGMVVESGGWYSDTGKVQDEAEMDGDGDGG